MTIHVVQQGDTINSIADFYRVPVNRIIIDNELKNPERLVLGESIVITFPETTYIVQDGDTLLEIANKSGISVIQLLRNNPFLSDREYIIPPFINASSFVATWQKLPAWLLHNLLELYCESFDGYRSKQVR